MLLDAHIIPLLFASRRRGEFLLLPPNNALHFQSAVRFLLVQQQQQPTVTGTSRNGTTPVPARYAATAEEAHGFASQPSLLEDFLLQCFMTVPLLHGLHHISPAQSCRATAVGDKTALSPRSLLSRRRLQGHRAYKTCSSEKSRDNSGYEQQRDQSLFVKLILFLHLADIANLAATSRLSKELLFPSRYHKPLNASIPATCSYHHHHHHHLAVSSQSDLSAAATAAVASPCGAIVHYNSHLNNPQAYLLREKAYALLLWRAACEGPLTHTYSCCVELLRDVVGNYVSSYRAALQCFVLQQQQWLSFRPFFHEKWQHCNLYGRDPAACKGAEEIPAPHVKAKELRLQLESPLKQSSLQQQPTRVHAVEEQNRYQQPPKTEVLYISGCQSSDSRPPRVGDCAPGSLSTTITSSGLPPSTPLKECVCSRAAGDEVPSSKRTTVPAAGDGRSSKREHHVDIHTCRRQSANATDIEHDDMEIPTVQTEKHYFSEVSPETAGSEIQRTDHTSNRARYPDGSSFLTAVACSRLSQLSQLPVFVSALCSNRGTSRGSLCRLWTFPDEMQLQTQPASPPFFLLPTPPSTTAQPYVADTSTCTWWTSWMQYIPQKPALLVIQQQQQQYQCPTPGINRSSSSSSPAVSVSIYDMTTIISGYTAHEREDEQNEPHLDKRGLVDQKAMASQSVVKSVSSSSLRTVPVRALPVVRPVKACLFTSKDLTGDADRLNPPVKTTVAGIVDATFSSCACNNYPFHDYGPRTMDRLEPQDFWEPRPKQLWALLANGSLLVVDLERLVPISKHTAERCNAAPLWVSRENCVVGRRVLPFSAAGHCWGATNGSETSAAVAVHEKALFFADTRTPHMSLLGNLGTENRRSCAPAGGLASDETRIIASDATGATVASLLQFPQAISLWDIRGGNTFLAVPPLNGFRLVSSNRSFELRARPTSDSNAVLLSTNPNSAHVCRYTSERFAYFTAADAATAGCRDVVSLSRRLKVQDMSTLSNRCDALQATVLRRAAVKVTYESIFVVQQRQYRREKPATNAMAADFEKAEITNAPTTRGAPRESFAGKVSTGSTSPEVETTDVDGVIHQWYVLERSQNIATHVAAKRIYFLRISAA